MLQSIIKTDQCQILNKWDAIVFIFFRTQNSGEKFVHQIFDIFTTYLYNRNYFPCNGPVLPVSEMNPSKCTIIKFIKKNVILIYVFFHYFRFNGSEYDLYIHLKLKLN